MSYVFPIESVLHLQRADLKEKKKKHGVLFYWKQPSFESDLTLDLVLSFPIHAMQFYSELNFVVISEDFHLMIQKMAKRRPHQDAKARKHLS